MEITRVEKVNLVDAVFTQLRKLILSGEWPEGTKLLSENELAKQFSVSRVVIREALQKLRGEKLIITRQGIGTYVANPNNFVLLDRPIALSEQVYKDFLEFRQAVELTAVKLSKSRATEEDFKKLNVCVDAMQNADRDDSLYNIADYSFHLAVVEASHNDMLVRAMVANQNMIVSVFSAMNDIPGARDFGVTSHRQIVENLRSKRIKTVVDSYNEMGRYNLARLQRFFQETGK